MDRITILSSKDLSQLSHYLKSQIAPRLLEWDEQDHFPYEEFRGMHALGLFAAPLPEYFGGTGNKMIDLISMTAEIAYFSPGLVSAWLANILAATAIYRFADENKAKEVLRSHLEERTILAFCATELESGNDIQRIATHAVPCAGGFKISGSKHFITNVNYASHFVVFAKLCDESGTPEKMFSAFLVPANSPGISRLQPLKKLGHRESDTGGVVFSEVFVPSSSLIGAKGTGYEIISSCISRTKTLLTAAAVGICRRAEAEATEYLATTQRYGEPLLARRDIQAVLSAFRPRVEAAWLLAARSGAVWDKTGNAVYECSVAKMFAADLAVDFVQEALELTGGTGYMRTSMLSKLYRDVKVLEIYEGATLVLQSILGREMFAGVLKKVKQEKMKEAA